MSAEEAAANAAAQLAAVEAEAAAMAGVAPVSVKRGSEQIAVTPGAKQPVSKRTSPPKRQVLAKESTMVRRCKSTSG